MRYLVFFIGSMAAALALFLVLTFALNPGANDDLELDSPIVVVMKATVEGQPMNFWTVVQLGISEAAKEFGVDVEIIGPDHERQIHRQVNMVNRVIENRPPALILAASDYNLLAEPVEKAVSTGIPVITVDSGVNSNQTISFIATDNVAAGMKAGGEVLRLLSTNPEGRVAIVSHVRETATAIERERGVRQAVRPWEVAGTWYCENDEDIAYEKTLEILQDPTVQGIVALNELVTLGAARAIEDTQSQNRIAMVGFDNAPEELAYLERGILDATVVQRPYNMGYMAVKTAVRALKGKEVESWIDTGSVLITATNMFERDYQELLFPIEDY